MKKTIFIILSFFLSALAIGQDKATILDSIFTSLYIGNKFNGNVLVAEKGNIVFEKSYGFANEKTKEKLNAQSVFELASVSKQFTAMAIVLLQKQGKLRYDEKISKYLPELSFFGNVTIRNLLNHTGGLPDYMDLLDKKWNKTKIATNQDIINQFAKYKPSVSFSPNEKWEYSNTGYALLAAIIERVSKKLYEDFLQTAVFKPLKMNNTFVYRRRYKPQRVTNYALGYETDSIGNKVLPDDFGKEYYIYFLDGIVGDGMVNSNTKDLLKWDRALYTNQIINNDDRNLIFSAAKTKNVKETPYGFGWMIKQYEKYGKVVNHSGGWAGYVSFIERHLDNDKTIIILQNNMTRKIKIPIDEVRKVLYNEKIETDNLSKVTLKTEDLDKYLGIYAAPIFLSS